MVTKYLDEIDVQKAYDIAYKNALLSSVDSITILNHKTIREEFHTLTGAELVQVGTKLKEFLTIPYNSIRFKSEADLTMFLLKWS